MLFMNRMMTTMGTRREERRMQMRKTPKRAMRKTLQMVKRSRT